MRVGGVGGVWGVRLRRRDDVDIVCTTEGAGVGCGRRGGTPCGVETPRADVSTCVGGTVDWGTPSA